MERHRSNGVCAHFAVAQDDEPTRPRSVRRRLASLKIAELEGHSRRASSPASNSPPSKKQRMLDQQQEAAGVGGAASGLTPNAASSVAARLLKKMSCNTGTAQNGASAALLSPQSENGLGHVGDLDATCVPAIELSSTDRELVRIVGQHLLNMGMNETVETLIRESGCRLEHPAASKFRQGVLSGAWDQVVRDLGALRPFVERSEHLNEMKFAILEQKYLELLEKSRVYEALQVLRDELSPLLQKTERVHQLTSFLMLNNPADLKRVANWEGSSAQARQKLMDRLQGYLPASVMLPPRRLEFLLQQALDLQKYRCVLHNTSVPLTFQTHSVLADHSCGKQAFPSETHQILSDHGDEVWHCQFSHSGRYLATGSKEPLVIIWEVDPLTKRLKRRAALDGHTYGASFLCWSPDDCFLAVVGPEDGPDLWLWDVEDAKLRVRMCHSPDDSISTMAWCMDGQRLVCGGTKGQFYLCDLDGNVVENWEGVRIRCLRGRKDGRTVLAADTHHRIRSYCFEDLSDKTLIKEDHSLMFFTTDTNDRYAACNIAGQGVHLWDLETRSLVRRYRGTTQGYYTIFSCFGGVNDDFIASGSEDGHVYVWHRDREEPAVVLKGHTSVVNAVTWNPADPSMLVSCSDDGTVRVWGPEGYTCPVIETDEPTSGTMSGSEESAC